MQSAERLREQLREKMGERSQAAFGAELGMRQAMVSNILAGRRGISRELGERIMARYPDLDPYLANYFYGRAIPQGYPQIAGGNGA